MPSPRLQVLQEQLASLRTHLLPGEFDPTGTYDDAARISTTALAYRVLAHAEIEAFFEDRALEVVTAARAAWDRDERVSRTCLCLMSFSGRQMSLPPDTLEAPTENKRKAWPELLDIRERLIPVLSAFHNFVRSENHGIKEKNLLALLLPIGMSYKKMDPAFLADMDSFGALRGIAAHSSARSSVQQAINPADELKRVDGLLPGIVALDAEIDSLLQHMQQ